MNSRKAPRSIARTYSANIFGKNIKTSVPEMSEVYIPLTQCLQGFEHFRIKITGMFCMLVLVFFTFTNRIK